MFSIGMLVIVALALVAASCLPVLVLSRYLRSDARVGALGRGLGNTSARTGAGGIACGFGSTPSKYLAFRQVVNANAQAAIVQTPQEKFKASRVIIPSSIGLFFTVDDMSVGTSVQNVAPGTGFLAQTANEAHGGLEVCFSEVCDIGLQCRMLVTNLTGEAQTFFAVWTGESAKTCP